MNGSEEIASELVVSSGDTSKVLEAAKASFDDVSTLVGLLAERMEDDAVGFVRNDRRCPEVDDVGAQLIAVVAFVGQDRLHGRSERQHVGRSGNVGVLAGSEMKDDGPAVRITQAMDFGCAPAARAADWSAPLGPDKIRQQL